MMTLLTLVLLQLFSTEQYVRQPRDYASAAGQYVLRVDPSHPYAAGPGHHEMRHAGEVVWSSTLPFCLWEARVLDDGRVFGVAYSEGHAPAVYGDGCGTLQVIVLGARGEVLLREEHERKRVGMRCCMRVDRAPAPPSVESLFLQPELDRFVVWVSQDNGEEEWWCYRLSRLEKMATLRPQDLTFPGNKLATPGLQEVRPVPGTPLTVLAFRTWRGLSIGSLFWLVDEQFRPLWRLKLPGDHSVMGDEPASRRRENIVRERGVLGEVAPRRFQLWRVDDEQLVTFEVGGGPGEGWHVEEVERKAHPVEEDSPPPPAIPALGLAYQGALPLGTSGGEPPAHITSYGFGDNGELRVAVWDRHGPANELSYELRRVGPDGAVLQRTPLELPAGESSVRCFPLSGQLWLVTRYDYAEGTTRGWLVHEESGHQEEIPGLPAADFQAAVPLPDGGLLAVVRYHEQYSMHEALVRFDAGYQQLWERDGSALGLSSLHGVALTRAGAVVVADSLGGSVQVVGLDGNLRRSLRIEDVHAGLAAYGPRLHHHPDGGFLLSNDDIVAHLDEAGTVRSLVTLRSRDSDAVQPRSTGLEVAPDGSLWSHDGSCFVRYGAHGEIARVVGTPPDALVLEEVSQSAVDAAGVIWVSDHRSGAVHRFADDGRRLEVLEPPLDDGPAPSLDLLVPQALAGIRDAVTQEDLWEYDWLDFGFDADGGRWSLKDGLHREQDGAAAVHVQRTPEDLWFRPTDLALRPDGQAAVLDPGWEEARVPALSLFDHHGGLVASYPLPAPARQLACSNEWACLTIGAAPVVLLNFASGELHRLELEDDMPPEDVVWWALGFSADGQALVAVERRRPVMHRWELP